MPHARQQLGQLGEDLAADFCLQQGWRIIGRNLRDKTGEIDILAQDGEVIVLIEVKAMQEASLDHHPIHHITPQKQRKLSYLVQRIASKFGDRPIRVDAVCVYWSRSGQPTISHFPNIFGL